MSENLRYASAITAGLYVALDKAIVRAARDSYEAAMNWTLQDSGQAAFNWKFSINTHTQRKRFLWRKGTGTSEAIPPVGDQYDYRGMGDRQVIDYNLAKFDEAVKATKRISSIMIYNPIKPEAYAQNANLEIAAEAAMNEGILDDIVAQEMRKARSI